MKLLARSLLVSSLTLLSRILGFVREAVATHLFGASAATDAFFAAFRMPNFLRQLFAEGVFSMALVPILTEIRQQRGEAALKTLVERITGTLSAILLLLAGLALLGAPALVSVLAPGFGTDPGQAGLATLMLRLTLPYLVIVALVGLAGAVLQVHERFLVPALTPLLLNLSLIATPLLLARHLPEPTLALALAVLLGGTLQLLLQIVPLARLRMLPRPRFDWRDPDLRRAGRLLLPTLLAASVVQLNLLVDSAFASLLQTGSVTWIYLADRLLQFPQGLFGVALGVVVLQQLASAAQHPKRAGFAAGLDHGLRLALLLALPPTLVLALLAEPLLWTVFGHGQFGGRDVQMTAEALRLMALGLPAFLCLRVLGAACYALQDTALPLRAAALSLLASVLANALLAWLLLRSGSSAPHAGIGLASALATLVNAAVLYAGMRRRGVLQHGSGWPAFLLRLLLAGSALLGCLAWLAGQWPDWPGWSTGERLLRLTALLAAGGSAYFGTLLLLGLRPRHLASPMA